ncbi:MAG: dipeptide/oligopeptide/nickel ABC transporter permease/ATP-binding protein, partial [Treponema sp.]|nr:dipeptide/oligopeptide/nickel ABC transporter permease/ATP-binding protein [Treponema sp.]
PTASFPEQTCHPPNVRFYGGKIQAQEARVINRINWKYARVRGVYEEITFLGSGEPYRLWGLIPASRHLFTVKPGGYPVFLMGADNLGRDVFSRIVYGARISLTIGFAATAVSLVLAIFLGGLAGYFGGASDWFIMRVSEFFMLIPGLYLILFLRSLMASTMDSGQAYMMITIILSLVGWPGTARTIRGMVHAIKREEFVLNARLEMIPAPVIISGHIIPQIASLLIVSIALSVPGFIMTETTLSYLGLGITDPAVSWGSLIKRDISTLSNLRNYPWLLWPVWFLLTVTLAFNFIGDCLRDFYDPYHVLLGRREEAGGEASVRRSVVVRKLLSFFRRRAVSGTAAQDVPARGVAEDLRRACGPEQGWSAGGARDNAAVVKERTESGPPSSLLLQARDLAVSFPVYRGRTGLTVRAVRGISYDLGKGEILGIVGESGSGKSVGTQAIASLLPKNAVVSGSIRYEGRELLGLDAGSLRAYRGKKIGMIYQEPGRSYDPLQNMGNVFWETFRNSEPGITKEEALEKAAALLAETGLPRGRERLSNFPHQFSGGQLQRIGIALALAQGCELLIADEPTTALDVTIQKQIVALLRGLRERRRISIIFISHDIDLVAEISGRILVMYGGLIMESGPAELFTGRGDGDGDRPRHPYTKALLAASPRFGSHYSKARLRTIPGRVTDPSEPEPGCPFAPRCGFAKSECTAAVPPLAVLDREGRKLAGGEAGEPFPGGHEFRCVLEAGEGTVWP